MILCERCRRAEAVDRRHRLPRSRGGPDDDFNLASLCRPCHRWVEEHPEDARKRRLSIPGYFTRSDPGCCMVYVGRDALYAEHYNRGDHARGCEHA